MGKLTETVFLVDDDPGMLRSMTRALALEGWLTRTYGSAREFLAAYDESIPGCLVVDLLMPEMSGLELQQELQRLGQHLPIIFLSGRADIPASVQAMKFGAVDFLTKPVDLAAVLTAVRLALARDQQRRSSNDAVRDLRERYSELTARERQVLAHVASGLLNKQIAGELGIVEKTVKVHRARAIAKLGARSTADLVRMVEKLGTLPA